METRLFYLFVLIVFVSGCTSDDEGNGEITKFVDVQGRVLGTVACQTDSNELAYQILVEDNPDLPDRIITGSLPDQFKQNGLGIRFDMQNSPEGFGLCVQLYAPSDFYRVYNVTLNPSAQ